MLINMGFVEGGRKKGRVEGRDGVVKVQGSDYLGIAWGSLAVWKHRKKGRDALSQRVNTCWGPDKEGAREPGSRPWCKSRGSYGHASPSPGTQLMNWKTYWQMFGSLDEHCRRWLVNTTVCKEWRWPGEGEGSWSTAANSRPKK